LLNPPCVASAEFSSAFSRVAPGEEIFLVTPSPDWRMIASLAAERRLAPTTVAVLPLEPGAKWALAREERLDTALAPWSIVQQARGWALLHRN
jgi:hypothetical protein